MTERTVVTVLLVEDNPGNARLVEILLSGVDAAGFEVTRAGGLSEALEHLDRSGFDVVLLDLPLPDSNGLATVGRMQSAAPTRRW